MKTSWIIALRELVARIKGRTFLMLSLLGPLVVLGLIWVLFVLGDKGKQHWRVLIADPTGIMENKILANEDKSITYAFADGYVEMTEFRDAKQFQDFDALIEINEKVLSNKTAFVFYREKPSVRMQTKLQYHTERRIEEVLAERFIKVPVEQFRKVKQPLNVAFRNVYDPTDQASDLRGWVGLFYGVLIFVFIFLFGMTIMRSVSREKSNRIVEVLLGAVHPNQLLMGKIIGVGLAAFIQFLIWIIIIGTGLVVLRETVFLDAYNPANVVALQLNNAMQQQPSDLFFAGREYNEFVQLVYERIEFSVMTFYFLLFFILGYLFYGAFFAAIGATSGSESDGQQFVLPLVGILCFALYAGYYTLLNPASNLANWFQYIPFTAPVVVMVKLALGYGPGELVQFVLAILVLVCSSIAMLFVDGRLYRNGILHFGHRIGIRLLFNWLLRK